MQEALARVFSYLLGVWRHRWPAVAIAWVIALAGWAFVWQMPEAFKATARIYADTNSILRPLMQGLTIQPDVQQQLKMMSQTLLSRPNLEKLTRMTDLDLTATTESEQDALIARLEGSIKLKAEARGTSFYTIEVTDPDRDLAKSITQSLITVFIESSLNDKRIDASGAQSFLNQQIDESEKRLVAAEQRLAKFKQDNVDVLSGNEGSFYGRMQAVRDQLAAAKLQLQEAINRRDELNNQISNNDKPTGDTPVGVASPYDARIETLQTQRDQLLTKYTAVHPEVRQLTALIEGLEEQRTEFFASVDSGDLSGMSDNPVYQSLRTMRAEADALVAELQVRVAEYESRVQALEEKVNLVPQIEADLKQLDRDYNVISQQHQQMLQRREAARLSEDVDENAGQVVFRVVDPPFVPLVPSEPNKLALNAVVLIAAIGAGVAVALAISLINPLIYDARTLVHLTGLPLLGAVTHVVPDDVRRRERLELLGFVATFALLPVGYVLLAVVQVAG